MKSNHRSILGIVAFTAIAMSLACAPAAQQGDTPRRGAEADAGQTDQDLNTPGGRDRNTGRQEDRGAAERFFNDRILPAWRNTAIPRCMDCHDAPRNTIGNPDAGGLSIYDFGRMYRVLRDGPSPNDNELMHILIGNRGHPGPRICRTEQDAQCALVIEWWNAAFTENGEGGAFSLGRIQTVSARGQVSGYATDPNDADAIFQVRLYIDGDREEGTLLSEVTANVATQINGLLRARGFSFKIPDPMITNNQERIVHAYALVDGEEVELGASPITFVAYAPRGRGAVGNNYPTAAESEACSGCHNFSYETLYGALLAPAPRNGGTEFNNVLWRMMATGPSNDDPNNTQITNHSGGRNAGIAAATRNWWRCEFLNQC